MVFGIKRTKNKTIWKYDSFLSVIREESWTLKKQYGYHALVRRRCLIKCSKLKNEFKTRWTNNYFAKETSDGKLYAKKKLSI